MAWSASKVFAYTVLQLCDAKSIAMSTDSLYCALYVATITPDNTVATAALSSYNGSGSQWVTANEVSSSGYVAGGASVSGVTVTQTTNVIALKASGSPAWTGVTFTTAGALVYDASVSNQGFSYNYFGGTQTVASANFSVVWNASGILTFTT